MKSLNEYIKEGLLDDDFDVDFSHEKTIKSLMKWKANHHIDIPKKDYDKVKQLINKDLPKANSIDEIRNISTKGLLYLDFDQIQQLYGLRFYIYDTEMMYGGLSAHPNVNWKRGAPYYTPLIFWRKLIDQKDVWIVEYPELFLTTIQKYIL